MVKIQTAPLLPMTNDPLPDVFIGWFCQCGERLTDDFKCSVCGKSFIESEKGLQLIKHHQEASVAK